MRGADWIPLANREKLSLGRLFCMALTQLTANFIWIPTGTLLNPLLQKLNFTNTISSFVYLMGPISGLIVSPLIGIISDNTTWKIGRRRGYLIIGEVLAVTGMMLLAFIDRITSNYDVRASFCFLGYFIVCTGGNILSMPGRAMVTDLTPRAQQVQAANICTLQQGLAGIVSAVFGAVQLPKYFNGSFGYEQFVLLLCSILGLIALTVAAIASPEERLTEKVNKENPFSAIWNVFKTFNLNIYIILIAHTFIAVGNKQWDAQFAVFFGRIIYGGNPTGSDEEITKYNDGVAFSQILYCLMTLFQIIFCLFSHYLTNRIGLRGTWALGLICGILGTGFMNFKFYGDNKWLYIFACLLYSYFLVTTGGVLISVISLYISKESMCCAQGILNFFLCIGQFISTICVQWLLGNYMTEQMDKGNYSFGPGNLIGVSPIPLTISLIFGFIGISRTEKAHKQDNSIDNRTLLSEKDQQSFSDMNNTTQTNGI